MANPKWKKNAKNNNLRIVWADSVLKINRKDGKVNCIFPHFFLCLFVFANKPIENWFLLSKLRFPLASSQSPFSLFRFQQLVLYVELPSIDILPAFRCDNQTISTLQTRLKTCALGFWIVTQQLRDDPNNIKTLGEALRDVPRDTKGDERVARRRVPDCNLGQLSVLLRTGRAIIISFPQKGNCLDIWKTLPTIRNVWRPVKRNIDIRA